MVRIFNYENRFFQSLSKISDLITLNLIFIISAIPVVTIGASLTSLYYVAMKLEKGESDGVVKEFIYKFKLEFKMSTIIWLILLSIGIVLGVDFYIFSKISNDLIRDIFLILLTIGSMILMFLFVYVFPFISKFENNIKNTIVNSLLISIQNLPYTLLICIITLMPILSFILFSNYWGQIIFFNTVMSFSIVSYINSVFLNKILNKYI